MLRITPQAVRRILHRHHYYVNSHYISNLIVIRNSTNQPHPYTDTLIIFCDELLKSTWHRYNVSMPPINYQIIKEGQYINAFKLEKLGNQDALIQDNPITMISIDISHPEQTDLFNLAIFNPKHCQSEDNPHSVIHFQNIDEYREFFAYCNVASRFNAGIFSLTLFNLSEI